MLDPNGTLIVQFINFFILAWLLKRYAYKPILKILQDRRERIENDLNNASQASAEAEAELQKSKNKLAEARAEAAQIKEKALKEADKEAQAHIAEANAKIARDKERAKAEIEAEKERAHEQLRAELITLSVAVAEKLLNKEIDAAMDEAIVSEAIDKLDGKRVGSHG